jgi:hypothetical protein
VSSDVGCNGNTEISILQHAVTLGIYCRLSTSPYYFYGDSYIECGNDSYNFDRPYDMGGRHLCSTSVTFPTGSSGAVLNIPNVSIVTDDTWLLAFDEDCFTQTVTVSPPFVPVPVTLSPVSVSNAPITAQPMFAPTPRPFVQPRGTPIESTSSGGAPVGAVIGGTIGGMVVICLVVIILILSKKKNHATAATHGQSNKPSSAHNALLVRHDHDTSFSPTNFHDVTANEANIRNNYPTPVIKQLPMDVSGAAPLPVPAPQPHYEVNYKDQARTVIVQQQQQPISVVPTDLPVVVAMEVSAALVGSTHTAKAEPPGRQFLDV